MPFSCLLIASAGSSQYFSFAGDSCTGFIVYIVAASLGGGACLIGGTGCCITGTGAGGCGHVSLGVVASTKSTFEGCHPVFLSILFLLFLSMTKNTRPATAIRPRGIPTEAPTIVAVLSLVLLADEDGDDSDLEAVVD